MTQWGDKASREVLRKLAEAATPGWGSGQQEYVSFTEVDRDEPGTFFAKGPTHSCAKEEFFEQRGNELRVQMAKDRRFIAASHPQAILSLLDAADERDKLRAKVERYEGALREIGFFEGDLKKPVIGVSRNGAISEYNRVVRVAREALKEGE